MNNFFSASVKHVFLLAVFLFVGFAQVWGQNVKLKGSDVTVSESAVLWKNESFGQHDMSKELIEKRDAFSKHFANASGNVTAIIASGPIHYHEDGQWKTIYHTISPSVNGFENIYNSHKTYYPATSTGNITTVLESGVELKDMLGMRMYYEANGQFLHEQNIQSKPGKANFNELTYSDVYGSGIDLRLTQNTTQRKMDYIIQHKTALGNIPANADFLVFEEKIELPVGWKANLKDDVIYLADASGEVHAVYEKPEFEEAPDEHNHDHKHESDNHKAEKISGNYEILQNGNLLIVKTKVPLSWLTNSDRNFPVIIDPTIDIATTNANWWTGTMETNGTSPTKFTTTSNTSQYNGSNYNNAGLSVGTETTNYVNHPWAKFNISSIPNNITSVNSVVLYLRHYSSTLNAGSCRSDVSFRHIANDPVTATAANRLTDIRDGTVYATYSYTNANTGTATDAWDSYTLGNGAATDVYNNLNISWFGVGLNVTGQGDNNDRVYLRSHTHANRPYISVDYSTCTTPTSYTVSGGGSYCTGESALSVSINGSQSGVSYMLKRNGTNVTSQNGNGSALTWTGLTTSGTYTVEASGTGYCTITMGGSAVINASSVPGSPAAGTFGSNTWNVYAYNGANRDDLSALTYRGYYTQNLGAQMGFNTEALWNSGTGSPSDAAGYVGCVVPPDNHTFVHKRQGFTAGTYQITINNWDDQSILYIDGVEVWRADVWSGNAAHGFTIPYAITDCYTLGAGSTIEFRTAEFTGGSNARITLSACGCANDTENRSYGNMTAGCNVFNEDTLATAYYKMVNVTQGVNYTFSTCDGTIFNSGNTPSIIASNILTIKQNNNNNNSIASNAGYGPDCNTTRGSLNWTAGNQGTIRAYVNNASCAQGWMANSSAVLKIRQNTTVNNTTTTTSVCPGDSKDLTYTLSGTHNNPAVTWSVVSGDDPSSISGSTYSPTSVGTKVIRATVGACFSDVTFDINPCVAPTVSSLNPTNACVNSGATITITGNNFLGASAVSFNGTPASSFTVVNNTTITATLPSGATTGIVTVTNSIGTSAQAVSFTVNPLPVITTQPSNLVLCEGANGNFTIATSSASPTYLWQYYNSNTSDWEEVNFPPNTSGQNTNTLSITNVPLTFNGAQIRVAVVSSGCYIFSNTVTITVNQLPAITVDPVDVTMCTGLGTQTLSVTATGVGLSYQWKKNGVDLVNDAIYSGVTTATLTITAPSASEDGALFTVEVSGTCAPSVLSAEAELTLSGSTAALPTNVYATNYIICEGQSINLNATAQGFTMHWFTQSSGGSAFTTSASGVNTSAIFPTLNTTYYVEAHLGSCVSPRIEVGTVYIIANNPPLIGYVEPQRRCDAGQVTLNSVTCSPGVINWYDSPQACVPIYTGNPYQPTVSSTTNFYTNVTDATARYSSNYESNLAANTFNGLSGQMFDVQAAPGKTIEITAVKVRSYYSSSQVLRVYYKTEALTQPSSFPVGQMSSAGWVQVHNGTYTGSGSENTLSAWLTLQNKIVVPAGCRFAIYIEHPVYYRGNSTDIDDRSNNDITIFGRGFGGASCSGTFNMCAAANRAFRGGLQYDVKFVSPIVKAPVVIDNSVAVPDIIGDNAVCKGQTIDLDTDALPTGGTITSTGGYRIHTFTSGSSTFAVPASMSPLNVEVLVVAGGGGGGSSRGGGGGAGGLIYNPSFTVSGSNNVVVGGGGAANTNGQNSSFASLTAIGGGRGGSHLNNDNGNSGGSGGGGAINYGSNIWSGGSATSDQGNAGGFSGSQGTDFPRNTGGGGGAGGSGVTGSGTNVRPNGGNGLAYDISGSIKYYAAGGGGSRGGTDGPSAGAGYGGIGGGGTGGGDFTQTAGTTNSGSGGGGSEGTGSAGGSGIVIVRYPDPTLGVWSSTNTASATVNSSGIVNGVSGGGSQIKYTLTTPIGCVGEKIKNVAVKEIPAVPTISDDSPVCVGQPINVSSKGLAPGGQVAVFNGTNSYVEVTQDIPEYNFTIEMWVKTSAANTGIFSVADGAFGANGHDRHLYLSGGQLWARVYAGVGWNTGYTINDNQWHHIALTVETGVGQRVYIDGTLVGTNPYDYSDFNWQTRFYIGFSNDAGANAYFNGEIDNFRIWNTAKTQVDLVSNMNIETPISSAGLIFHCNLNGNSNASTGPNGAASNLSWTTPSHYTYTWSGINAPTPASSNNEERIIYGATAGNNTITVTASDGVCAGGNATTDIEVKTNNQTASSWNALSTDDNTDWFDAKNWSNCVPGDQTIVTISRDKPAYPVITNTSSFDINPKGKGKAKKVTLDTSGSGVAPTLDINTDAELRVNE